MALNTRQRIILHLLNQGQSSTGRIRLVKWLFLYSRAEVNPVSKYDFVPYKFGPHSFEVYQDMGYALARFIERWDAVDNTDTTIRLKQEAIHEIKSITSRIPLTERRMAETIWLKYQNLTRQQLLQTVYDRYPWYTSRSELTELVTLKPTKIATPAIYTIGYEGRSIDAFLNTVLLSGLQGILDVRSIAYSQKFGFSGNTLRTYCNKIGLTYNHLHELGVASEMRKNLQVPGALDRLFEDYEHGLQNKGCALQQAATIIESCPTALMCFESEATRCHRGKLAPWLAELTNLEIVHL